MSKIRKDLVGVVYAAGQNLKAGDEVPKGVSVDDSLVEGTAKAEKAPESAENNAEAPESNEEPAEPETATEEPVEDDSEDFSDILGGADEPKSAPKRTGGRKPAAKRS